MSYHYPDKSPFQHNISVKIPEILSIGWLDGNHSFPTGTVPPDFIKKLESLILNFEPGQVLINRLRSGKETCEICGTSALLLTEGDQEVALDFVQLFIPGEGVYYCAPGFILHYITDHNYLPPDEFINAVNGFIPESKTNGQNQYFNLLDKYYE